MRNLLGPLAAVAALLSGALAQQRHDASFTPEYVLEALEGPIDIDCNSRVSVTLNGTSPGPPLTMREGHTTWVRVYNRLASQNVTVHWHGLSQRAAPFSDGTPLVSQWPIAPGQYFDYQIRPEVGDAGTYYYHSHVGFQRSTAQGPLIVEDARKPPYKYDDDITIMLGDFYKKSDQVIEAGLLGDPFTWSGEPDAVTFNDRSGKSGFNNATGPSCAPKIIDVEAGKTYRVRTIGATLISLVKVGIESHSDLQVIEADGTYTKAAAIDHMQVASGQRMSYLLKTMTESQLKKAGKRQFWIRYETRERPASITGYALLRYASTKHSYPAPPPPHRRRALAGEPTDALPATPPVKLPATTYDYLEYKLTPQDRKLRDSFPGLDQVTRTVKIQINQKLISGTYVDGKPNGTLVWVQNDNDWQETVQAKAREVPYLVEVYVTGTTPNYTNAIANGGFDPETRTFPAKVGEVLDIVWENNNGPSGGWDYHPMHAHGEHIWDLGGGNGTYDAAKNEAKFSKRPGGFIPTRRDTTNLYRYATSGVKQTTAGWRAWRIKVTADNVGAWMLHCHVAQHATMGMNTVWVFGEAEDILKKFPATPYVNGYLDYGGSAYGSDTTDPLVYHYFKEEDDVIE